MSTSAQLVHSFLVLVHQTTGCWANGFGANSAADKTESCSVLTSIGELSSLKAWFRHAEQDYLSWGMFLLNASSTVRKTETGYVRYLLHHLKHNSQNATNCPSPATLSIGAHRMAV